MNNEITNPFNLVIIIIGLFLGIVLGLFLLFNNSAKNKANIYLGILVLLSLGIFIPSAFFRFDLLEQFPHVIGSNRLIPFLIGPLTYLYVRACIQKGFEMRPILWLHFLPFVIDFFFLIPFFLQSSSEKLAYVNDLLYKGDYETNSILTFFKMAHLVLYFSISIKLIFQYKKHLSNMASSIDHAFHNWVLVFISLHLIPSLSLIWYAYGEFSAYSMAFTLLSFFFFSVAILIAALVKPELFHSFPHQMLIPESTEDKIQKYESSNLQVDQKENYLKKLIQHVELNKPYLEGELTLAQLSKQTKIPSHYLSQVINEKLNCNFLDFINGYRLKEAKEKLANNKFDHYTIIAIAFEAGFNSKSAFYTAFKKQVGDTPSNYRKSFRSQ